MKGRYIRYSENQLAWIRRHRRLPRHDLHVAFVKKFRRRDVSLENLKALCTRKGWRTGRDGRLRRGNVPHNKGKKMPYNANSARTRFKTGNRTGRANHVYKPIGTIRSSKEGYLERKIHDGLPMQSRWRAVHLLNWEEKHGPVPKGMCLKCKGERTDTDPSNWELIPRALLPRLAGRWTPAYDGAPDELKPTIMAVAKLEHRLRENRAVAKGVKRAIAERLR
jgi:hypothetical protein